MSSWLQMVILDSEVLASKVLVSKMLVSKVSQLKAIEILLNMVCPPASSINDPNLSNLLHPVWQPRSVSHMPSHLLGQQLHRLPKLPDPNE